MEPLIAVSRPSALQRFFEHCHHKTYPAKTILIKSGDHSEYLYYLISGSVSVLIEDDDGHEFVLAYLHEGDFFGEIGMFDERHERSAWVSARTDIEVAQLGYESLVEIAADRPDVICEMLGQLAARLRNTNRKVGDLAFTDVLGRVARSLIDLSRQPDAVAHPLGMEISITRQELGRIAGCSREMVSRVLRTLEERQMVLVRGRSIIVVES